MFESQSQAGQDRFVRALLPTSFGTFLDVGCAEPKQFNNTWALEQIGWSGMLLDGNINSAEACRQERKCPVICDDATIIDWETVLETWGKKRPFMIDYLSLDVDEATHKALQNIVFNHALRFRVLTVEHDAYQRGDRLRIPNRKLLKNEGYVLIASDVCSQGCPFEDWYVAPSLAGAAEKFMSDGMECWDVLRQGGAA